MPNDYKRRTRICGLIALICIAATGIPTANAGIPIFNDMPTLAPVVDKVVQGVVNIAVSGNVEIQNPLFADPVFRQFFLHMPNMPNQPTKQQVRSAGSGVIVDADKGYIVTNSHVVAVGQQDQIIEVTLKDKRHFHAKLIGRDPETDIAVLKIDADNLNAVELGDSDRLRVGDYALAVGNPFGLGQTVTSGIISALGRTGLGIEGYEDFIQTDAAINPGNSGGALVNLRGELVGINTAIVGPGGGNVGIGFAVPANVIKEIMTDLIKNGTIKRGQVGIRAQDLTPEIASSLDIRQSEGALIVQVAADSAAAGAGVLPGDLLVGIDNKPIRDVAEMKKRINFAHLGDTLTLSVIRQGKPMTIKVTVAALRASNAQLRQWN